MGCRGVVVPQEAGDLPGVEVEVQAVHSGHVPEILPQSADRDSHPRVRLARRHQPAVHASAPRRGSAAVADHVLDYEALQQCGAEEAAEAVAEGQVRPVGVGGGNIGIDIRNGASPGVINSESGLAVV